MIFLDYFLPGLVILIVQLVVNEIQKMSIDEIADKIFENIDKITNSDKIKPHLFNILSPVVREKKGEFKDLFDNLRNKVFLE
jgi:excinuclease UvrABC ATPase subunit